MVNKSHLIILKYNILPELIFIGLSIAFGLIIHAITLPVERYQIEQLYFAMKATAVNPPAVIPWMFTEIYYFLLLYLLFALLTLSFIKISIFLEVFHSSIDAFIYYTGLIFIVLLLHARFPFFITAKSFLYIFFIIIALTLYFKFRNMLNRAIHHLIYFINKHYHISVIILVIFSSFQRMISLYFENFVLVPDDPLTYYSQAIGILQNSLIPQGLFSPGMSFYLFGIFKLFGVGQVFPKIFMILIGAMGLFSLSLFVRSFFCSKILSVCVLLFYITSSHYVSFSNQFWNENLFHPLLSIFLLLSWNLTSTRSRFGNSQMDNQTGYGKLIQYISIILLAFIMLCLTLFRSWFPVLSIIWFGFVFYKIYFFKNGRVEIFFQSCSVILLYLILLSGYNYFIGSSNNGLVTSNSALNFLIGNNPYSQGTFTWHWKTFVRDYGIDVDKEDYINKIIDINCNDPAFMIKNITKKFLLWFIAAPGIRNTISYYQHPLLVSQYFYRITTMILLFYGAFCLSKYKKGLVFILLYSSIVFIHLIYFVEYRFTLTAMPFQALLISYGLLRFIRRISEFTEVRPIDSG